MIDGLIVGGRLEARFESAPLAGAGSRVGESLYYDNIGALNLQMTYSSNKYKPIGAMLNKLSSPSAFSLPL
jgi:hypothetical protein